MAQNDQMGKLLGWAKKGSTVGQKQPSKKMRGMKRTKLQQRGKESIIGESDQSNHRIVMQAKKQGKKTRSRGPLPETKRRRGGEKQNI